MRFTLRKANCSACRMVMHLPGRHGDPLERMNAYLVRFSESTRTKLFGS